jgi:hypothetical protein
LHCIICGVTAAITQNRSLAAVASHTFLLFLSTVYFCILFFPFSIPIFLFFSGGRVGKPSVAVPLSAVGFSKRFERSENGFENLGKTGFCFFILVGFWDKSISFSVGYQIKNRI